MIFCRIVRSSGKILCNVSPLVAILVVQLRNIANRLKGGGWGQGGEVRGATSSSMRSSSTVHASLRMSWSRWLCQRSRHCLPVRPGSCCATRVQLREPCMPTRCRTVVSSCCVHCLRCVPLLLPVSPSYVLSGLTSTFMIFRGSASCFAQMNRLALSTRDSCIAGLSEARDLRRSLRDSMNHVTGGSTPGLDLESRTSSCSRRISPQIRMTRFFSGKLG